LRNDREKEGRYGGGMVGKFRVRPRLQRRSLRFEKKEVVADLGKRTENREAAKKGKKTSFYNR